MHEEQHFPEVGHVVLTAGSRPGVSGELHGDACQDQRFCNGTDDLGIALPDPAALRQHCAQGGPDHIRDMFAVIFSGDKICQFPVEQAGVFAQHIPKTGSDHLHRRPRKDFYVCDEGRRPLRFIGDLDMVDDQGCSRGYKTVHGGRCRQNDIRQAL